ncbi:MAG: STAS domain-containing protein [Planctomycetota bacterium]
MFEAEFEDHDHLTVLTLTGDFAGQAVDHLRKQLVERLDGQTRDFVLDVSQLGRIDSAGLEALLWLEDSAAQRLAQVRIAGPNPDLETVVRITRLSERLPIEPGLMKAIESLGVDLMAMATNSHTPEAQPASADPAPGEPPPPGGLA